MPIVFIVLLASFIMAIGSGTMAYIAKTRWLDIEKTQRYALLSIVFTIIFMILGILTAPD